jgi:hypothetical protein
MGLDVVAVWEVPDDPWQRRSRRVLSIVI